MKPKTDQDVDDFLAEMVDPPPRYSGMRDLRDWLYRKFGRERVVAAISEDDDE